MDEDKIQYTTQTGETRVDVPEPRFVRTSREIDNVAKFTDWKSKKYEQLKGSTIIDVYGVNNFKSSFNKAVTLEIDPNQVYWFHRDKGKVGGLTNKNFETQLVKDIEKSKFGKAADAVAEKIGAKQNFVDDAARKFNINPKVLGGVIARGGAAWLDPVSEAVEIALGKVGLGKVASAWVKGEMHALVASAIAGVATGYGDYLGKQIAPAVQNMVLSGYSDVIPDPEPDVIDSLLVGLDTFSKGTEYLPSTVMYEKTAPVIDPMKDKVKNVIGAFR